jgi:hypothetical protein
MWISCYCEHRCKWLPKHLRDRYIVLQIARLPFYVKVVLAVWRIVESASRPSERSREQPSQDRQNCKSAEHQRDSGVGACNRVLQWWVERGSAGLGAKGGPTLVWGLRTFPLDYPVVQCVISFVFWLSFFDLHITLQLLHQKSWQSTARCIQYAGVVRFPFQWALFSLL